MLGQTTPLFDRLHDSFEGILFMLMQNGDILYDGSSQHPYIIDIPIQGFPGQVLASNDSFFHRFAWYKGVFEPQSPL
jgi:hypothetical protein